MNTKYVGAALVALANGLCPMFICFESVNYTTKDETQSNLYFGILRLDSYVLVFFNILFRLNQYIIFVLRVIHHRINLTSHIKEGHYTDKTDARFICVVRTATKCTMYFSILSLERFYRL